MPAYIVDPLHFHAEGGVVNWDAAAKRTGIANQPNKPWGNTLELRWMLSAELGLPTEPFQVWSRPHGSPAVFQPLTITQQNLFFAGNLLLVSWAEGGVSSVSVDVQAPGGGTLLGYAGGPFIGNLVTWVGIPAGNSTVQLSAKLLNCLVATLGVTVTAVRGVLPGGYANVPGWTLVETVGLPVTPAGWGGIGKHGVPQGMAGSLTDAPTAAIARLTRAAPPFGWGPLVAAGVPAPAWMAPGFPALVKEVNSDLLDFLHDIAKNLPPIGQAAQTVTVPLPPPENSSGKFTNKPGSTTQLSPLAMTYMAAATDPFLNLVLGFGTGYPFTRNDLGVLVNGPFLDFMVTAHWEKGFDGNSAPLDFAAIVPLPGAPLPPGAPANMSTDVVGALRPLLPNGDWRETVRVSWDRPPDTQLFRAAGMAAARVSTSPVQPAVALMQPRPSGGFRPIGIGSPTDPPHAQDPQWWRLHAMDREIDIPFNPGSRQMTYGAAVQDIYGQWTPWVATNRSITQPDLDAVRIVNPRLLPVAALSGAVWNTTLEMDFLWDWRIRSPQRITFVGRLYAAITHGDPAPGGPIPAGLDRSLAGGGAALIVNFAGDTPSAAGFTIIPVTEDGENQAAGFGPAQGNSRRYRITVTGLSLDWGSTGFIGMALWAQGQESIAPNRVSPWPAHPVVISTGDPRPPVVPVFHVKLGSIPDATGSSHVRIAWTAQPNAAGYFVYEATEAGLLDAWGLPEPQHNHTLDARLLVLRNNFKANPLRRPFTRWNATALKVTGTDITLPKGSTGIHLYIVLGVSAGQVESVWPAATDAHPEDAMIAVSAPHITKPAAPMIEVRQYFDPSAMPPAFKAKVLVTTRPGPRPAMVELYRVRVDDAAKEVDTMGPPVARLKSTGGAWIVNSAPDPTYGPYITTVQGMDSPPGSWKRVWYRATAWTAEDDTRGGLPGRSEASNAAWVVLPPTDGPVITALLVGTGPAAADVILEWTCPSPLKRTPLGPHQTSVRASVPGAAPPPLISLNTTLDAMDHTQPAAGSGAWIVNTASGVTTYRALIRRAAITDVVSFGVRITDPLGRTGAQLLNIPAGAVDPPPNLENVVLQKTAFPPPGHLILTFTSTSPIEPTLNGPYILKVTGVPLFPVFFPPPLTFTMPLGSVPGKLPPAPLPPGYIVRTGAGPLHTYQFVTAAHLKGFVVRITGPNGKFVEKIV